MGNPSLRLSEVLGHVLPNLDMLSKTNVLFHKGPAVVFRAAWVLVVYKCRKVRPDFFIS